LSPKHSILLKSIAVIIILAGLNFVSQLFFLIAFAILILFILTKISLMQKSLDKVKKILPLNEIYYWTLLPFLEYLKGIIRELGRIYFFFLKK